MAMLIPIETIDGEDLAKFLKLGGHIVSYQCRRFLRIDPVAYAEADCNDDEIDNSGEYGWSG